MVCLLLLKKSREQGAGSREQGTRISKSIDISQMQSCIIEIDCISPLRTYSSAHAEDACSCFKVEAKTKAERSVFIWFFYIFIFNPGIITEKRNISRASYNKPVLGCQNRIVLC